LKKTGTLHRYTRLAPGKPMPRGSGLSRSTRIAKVGARAKREAPALAIFRFEVLLRAGGHCERCGRARELDAHHMLSRARGRGWPLLHDATANGAALCSRRYADGCHRLLHDGKLPDEARWLKTRADVERGA